MSLAGGARPRRWSPRAWRPRPSGAACSSSAARGPGVALRRPARPRWGPRLVAHRTPALTEGGTVPSTHLHTCTLCEATCGVVVTVEGDQVVVGPRRQGRPAEPGLPVRQGPGARATSTTTPTGCAGRCVRAGDGWREVELGRGVRPRGRAAAGDPAEHGNDAVAVYQGNPTAHNLGLLTYGQRPLPGAATGNRFSATSVDQLPHMLAALEMFGHQLLLPVPDIDRTDLFICIGANPAASNGSLMTAPERARAASKAIRERGRSGGAASIRGAPRPPAVADRAPLHPARHRRPAAAVDGAGPLRRGPGAHDAAGRRARRAAGRRPRRSRRRRRRRSPASRADVVRAWPARWPPRARAVLYGRVGVSHPGVRRPVRLAASPRSTWSPATSTRSAGSCSRRRRSTSCSMHRPRSARRAPSPAATAACAACPSSAASCRSPCWPRRSRRPGPGQIRALVTVGRQPGAVDAERPPARARARASSTSWCRSTSTSTRRPGSPTSSCPPTAHLERVALRPALPDPRRAQHAPATCRRCSSAAADQRHDWEICLELASRLAGPAFLRRRRRGCAFRARAPTGSSTWLLRPRAATQGHVAGEAARRAARRRPRPARAARCPSGLRTEEQEGRAGARRCSSTTCPGCAARLERGGRRRRARARSAAATSAATTRGCTTASG